MGTKFATEHHRKLTYQKMSTPPLQQWCKLQVTRRLAYVCNSGTLVMREDIKRCA